MAPEPTDLAGITRATLEHYNRQAEQFRVGTAGHDVSQNVSALLDAIAGDAPHTILDLGCGPGRDLAEFVRRGHVAIGLDGGDAVAGRAL
jgi:SAM-dependent methyltransferase